ncbi:hypothetical protein HU200_034593 [Digitaria exilis]|uniref:Uncharacterized protein n=1 Tax=Digitaria exilis TaxID=1010633 RepID=A0A835BJW7_9POAL|nr:hypothetical protein HU200_034593 [Digitaria exilis]
MELAVGASESAMRSLLGKLGGLLAQEYTLISGVRSEIQYMTNELASMHAFLRKLGRAAASGAAYDEQTKDWIEQVRDVAYDIEDCVDDFAHRLGRQPRGEGLLVNLRRAWYTMTTIWARKDIASKIIDLKNRAQEVGERRTRYGVQDPKDYSRSIPGSKQSRPTHSYAADHLKPLAPQLIGTMEPVGLEDAIAEQGRWLTGSEGDVRILAIVGFGGLGKTTMALALQQRFGEKFDSRAWVQASQKLNLESLLRSILKQVMPQQDPERKGGSGTTDGHADGIEGWSEKQLKEKSYFLFLDDVWSVSSWQTIWQSLPRNQKGSSIVVTTRFKSVANACCHHQENIYMLKPLLHVESTKLFFERINDPNPGNFKEIKEEIIKKCGGLPLAIVAVAGLLSRRDMTDKSHWETVNESLNSDLDKNLSPEGVTQILNLCYNDLPADQKNCLLYLSIFPKGCSIKRKRLIRRWISEGFITEKDGKTVEEVAEDSFNELISRNIVRPVEHSTNGKVKCCQVHDMILEYIVSKSSEENFITVVGGHWLTPTPSNKVRRLSLHNSNPEDVKEKIENMNLSHVRSLTAFESLERLQSFSFKFGILQVLDLEGCRGLIVNHLRKICKMFHLKYLNLRKTSIAKLPSEIGKLQYLETLDIRETHVQELPASVAGLQKMAHLLGGNKSTHLALTFTEGISKMIGLQTLSGIGICRSSGAALADMHNLANLKKLSIYNLKDFDNSNQRYSDLLSAIEYLCGCSLKSLAIDDGFTGFLDLVVSLSTPPKYIHTLDLSGKLPKVPPWMAELENLKKLTLSLTSLRTDALSVLAQLPLLFSLTFSVNAASHHDQSVVKILMKNMADSGGKVVIPPDGFHGLKLLRFSAPLLPLLSFIDGAMPKLQRLELRFKVLEGCYGVENLESLQQVLLRVSQQASETTRVKVSDIRRSLSRHPNKPTVVVDEYYG